MNFLIRTLCVSLLLCAACTNDKHADAEDTTHAHEPKNEVLTGPLPEPEVLNENYQTVVMKGDIPSPRKRTFGKIDEASVSVTYGSPSVRGRTIWGGLEPYGEVWRTGANEATVFELSENMKIQGQDLAAGQYALFTIPDKDKWTIIFNEAYDQWGAFEYDEAKDVLRVDATPLPLKDKKETLDFIIDGNTVAMQWDGLHVPFKITKE